MDKETLSNYGWVVIAVLVLSIMIALATPFGTYISDGVKATTAGLFETSKNALDTGLEEAGITIEDQEFEDVNTIGGSVNAGGETGGTPVVRETIPAGGTYYKGVVFNEEEWILDFTNATEYTGGQEFPELAVGDVYKYGDYIYGYGVYYTACDGNAGTYNTDGWCVGVQNTEKSSYGEILTRINGLDVTNMIQTYGYCTNIDTVPVIPETITNMDYAFVGSSIKTAPDIPANVTSMSATFSMCYELDGMIFINGSVVNYDCWDFNGDNDIVVAGDAPVEIKRAIAEEYYLQYTDEFGNIVEW